MRERRLALLLGLAVALTLAALLPDNGLASAAASSPYLPPAHLTVGSSSSNTVNSDNPSGVRTTATAGISASDFVTTAQVSQLSPAPAHGDAGGYARTTDACAACHRATHASKIVALTSAGSGSTQESVCYTCHDGTGAPANIQAQFGKSSRHPLGATDLHRMGERSPSQFSGTSRHVECTDCHEPHAASKGTHQAGTSDAARVLAGTWGISVTNASSNWTVPTYSRLSPVTSEYQLCLKCHSSWAYGNSPPIAHNGGIVETNQALEFSVNNESYHWVEGDQMAASGSTPRTTGRSMAFATGSGWTAGSKMTCTDCHASDSDADPRGPHGSTQAYLLRGAWSTGTGKSGTSDNLCFKCHDWNAYGQGGAAAGITTGFSNGNNLHTRHLGYSETDGCQSCHSAVPHGGPYRALLAPRRLPDGTQPALDGYNQSSKLWLNAWAASGQWRKSSCGAYPTGCH